MIPLSKNGIRAAIIVTVIFLIFCGSLQYSHFNHNGLLKIASTYSPRISPVSDAFSNLSRNGETSGKQQDVRQVYHDKIINLFADDQNVGTHLFTVIPFLFVIT